MSSPLASSLAVGGVSTPLSPPDLADERDADSIRAALESGDQSKALDLPALLKSPDKFKKACRAGIPMRQRAEVWKALFDVNTQSKLKRRRCMLA
jgi:hypothetical protein